MIRATDREIDSGRAAGLALVHETKMVFTTRE